MITIIKDIDGKLNSFNNTVKPLANHYLGTSSRKIELTIYFIIGALLSYIQVMDIVALDFKGFISQIHSTIIILMVFRFSYIGLSISILMILSDIVAIIFALNQKSEVFYINGWLGLTLKLSTLMFAVFISMLTYKQEKQKTRLELLTIKDELTGAYNQRFFHMMLEKEIQKSQKSGESIGLIMLDIDDFKMFNDIYGHNFGDSILKKTVSILTKVSAEDECICRYGGDEFAIIVTGDDLEKLEKRAKDIQKDFESQKVIFNQKEAYNKLTLSIGFSEYPNKAKSKNELIYQADMALYHAKNLGKDKVHLYKDAILQIRRSISSDHQQLIGVFKGLLSTISAKDKYTLGHCERVSTYVVMIGEAMELDIKEISIIQYAALLHDIGKIEIPKFILNKKEKLTDEEFSLLRQHPRYSQNILEPLEGMDQLIDYVRHHHERYDGKGYPDRLKGDEISLGARILCVADSFDAMVSERPYSKKMTIEQAVEELVVNSGTHFDPYVVNVFIEAMKSKVA
ncbi:UNVERIFIED_CONTAM: diguanylate cyclase (GGDEF)-like protein [Acetivibrio alkalicellulosi]